MNSAKKPFVLLVFYLQVKLIEGLFDETLIPGSRGSDVVETVCTKIQSVCFFSDDKSMLRRIAYVESTDGQDRTTYRPGYFGGIWQVNETEFLSTKNLAKANLIKTEFNIDWQKVEWQDLLKPFYSGLAARLYLHSISVDVPRSIDDQAVLWANQYKKNGQLSDYHDKVIRLRDTCQEKADVAFVVDGSGSVESYNFDLIRAFLKNVIGSLNIGPDPKLHTRVSVIQFGSEYTVEFDFKSYSTLASYQKKIDDITYMDGWSTATYLALDYLTDHAFSENAGARSFEIPKIAIVLTDGASNDITRTLNAAARMHQKKGLTVFSIGVGASVNNDELEAIASNPKCKHLSELKDFNEFQYLVYAIKLKACAAPVQISSTIPTTILVANDTKTNCKLPITSSGVTYQITGSGNSNIYFSNKTFPTPSFHDNKFDVTYYTPAVVHVPGSKSGSASPIYCHITSHCKNSTITFEPTLNYVNACDPNPCHCNKVCLPRPNFEYICVEKIITPTKVYDCASRNPCLLPNSKLKTFPHQDPTKYVQCSQYGNCCIKTCTSESCKGLRSSSNI